MNFKTTGILAIILALGIGGVLLMNKQDARKKEEKKLEEQVLKLETAEVTKVQLLPAGIECVKDSADWRITAPITTDADKYAVEAVINAVKSAQKERLISSDPAEYAVFGLAPAQAELVLTRPGRVDTLYIGDESPTGSYIFARLSGSPDVFLTTTYLRTQAQKTLFDLRNKAVLGFETYQVRALQIQNKNGRFSLTKKAGEWSLTEPMETAADKSEVDKIINRLQSERMRSVVDENPADLRTYSLHAPTVRVDLSLGENLARKTLLIGKASEDKYYARDDSRPAVFLVDSSFVSLLQPTLFDLRNKKLANFNSSDVAKFELEFSNSKIVCSRDTSGTWTIEQPAGRKAKSWKMSSIVSEAADLKVARFADNVTPAAAGLTSPQAHAKFYDEEKLLLHVKLGKTDGDHVYVQIDDQPSVYLVDKSVLETWTPKLEDISEEP